MHNASPTTWTYMLRSPAHPRLALSLALFGSLRVTLTGALAVPCWGSPAFRCVHCTFDCSLALLLLLVLLCCCCTATALLLPFRFYFVSLSMRFDSKLLITAAFRTHSRTPPHPHTLAHTRLESTPSLSLSFSRILWLFVISFSTAAAAAEATNFFDKQRLISNLCISLYSFFFRESPYRSPSCLSTSHTFT